MKSILHQFVRNMTATFLKKKREGITESDLGNTPEFFKYAERSHLKVALFLSIVLTLISVQSHGQTAPVAQSLPYSQNFGTTTFTALPSGLAAWNGTLKTTQTLALTGTYAGNAVVATATASRRFCGPSGAALEAGRMAQVRTTGLAASCCAGSTACRK